MITTQFLQKQLTFLQFLKIAELVRTYLNNVWQLNVLIHKLNFSVTIGRQHIPPTRTGDLPIRVAVGGILLCLSLAVCCDPGQVS